MNPIEAQLLTDLYSAASTKSGCGPLDMVSKPCTNHLFEGHLRQLIVVVPEEK